MARASWDAAVSPHGAYEDHFKHVYGPASTQALCQVMRMLEDTTVILDLDFLSLLFPVPGTVVGRVRANKPMAEGLYHILATYESARVMLVSLLDHPSTSARRSNLDYWVSRLDFAIHALHEVRLLCTGGMSLHASNEAKKSGDEKTAAEQRKRAEVSYQQAIASGEAALNAAADNVRDDSDRGCLAAYYHFMVREVKDTVKEALEDTSVEN